MPSSLAPAKSSSDPLLRPFLDADDAVAEQHRDALMQDEALPVIRAVVTARFRRERHEVDDVCNDVVVSLLRHFDDLRGDGEAAPILSFRSYVAMAAHRACDARLRERYPERHRLRNRIRYVLTHRAEFFLHEDGRGWRCGLARQRVRADAIERLPDHAHRAGLHGEELVATLTRLFRDAGGPVDLDAVVSLLAQGLDERVESAEQTVRDEAEDAVEQQSHLRRLWQELLLLPRPQRVALLLHLRGGEGEELLSLVPHTGIATAQEIAAALAMSAEDLAAIWNELPLPDARIAAMLGLTRQQVINLRKSARERLGRRLRA